MHPALSVILFTVASGIGYGMLMLLAVLLPAGLVPGDRLFGAVALGLALAGIGGGLLASTAHLGRPERAWRAFSQWRSSWLSREGILAVLSLLAIATLVLVWPILAAPRGCIDATAIVAGLLSAATVGATAMIYRSLKPVARWHNGWTVPCYLTIALASGGLWLDWAGAATGAIDPVPRGVVPMLVLLAALVKTLYWRHTDRAPATTTIGTATGLGALGQVRPLDPPHTAENYVMKEMGFRIARKHAAKLRRIAGVLGVAVPLVLMVLGWLLPGLGLATALLAAPIATIGALVERWLFFAEAKHLAMLYYRADAA
ncbi:MAG TPA: DmsC/YnfH family molybdoenzyme membrane anchor subunit [Aliidongia sp.]|uniref:dimethyl sulfoxide reductase anchor subunit family protein n=1 Tax=Aliidongia sp. TaxID=1914230 RepID=UPI002DDCF243|nr:DmsC/YnfH family molybdoenzyme membrane anchor subunit [Aliidongia sp.]HEV2676911.1 DmsC/YnfH family molybdoenzyme membrane anchor subunit [Aliidongia sp.]